MVLKRGHVVLSNRRVVKLVVLMKGINVCRDILVVLLHRYVERRAVGRFPFVPIVVAMGFVVLRVNIWLKGFVVILMRVIVRVFVVRALVLLIRDVCLRRVGVKRLEGMSLVLLLGIVDLVRLVPTAAVLKRPSKRMHWQVRYKL
jgi:hypothetical protein